MPPVPALRDASRVQIVKWLRANLALTMFVLGTLSASGGALITGTTRVVRFDDRLAAIEKTDKKTATELLDINVTLGQQPEQRLHLTEQFLGIEQWHGLLDFRMTTLEHEVGQIAPDRVDRDARRIKLADDLGDVRGRISVLEAQIAFVALIPPPQRRLR